MSNAARPNGQTAVGGGAVELKCPGGVHGGVFCRSRQALWQNRARDRIDSIERGPAELQAGALDDADLVLRFQASDASASSCGFANAEHVTLSATQTAQDNHAVHARRKTHS